MARSTALHSPPRKSKSSRSILSTTPTIEPSNPAFVNSYTDFYASLVIGTGAYFGNRSVVVHYANKTRITCANFTTIATGYETPVPNPGPSGVPVPPSNATLPTASGIATGPTSSCTSSSATATPPSPPLPVATTNAAAAGMWVSSGAMLAGLVAMVLQ